MMLAPGSLISRTAALAILVLVLLAGYRLVARPIIEHYWTIEQRVAETIELLQRYRRLAAERPELASRLAALKDRGDFATGYWEGSSNALVAAQLQDRVAESIKGNEGTIRSIQTLDATVLDESKGLRRANLKLRFAADIEGLATIVHDIETADPYMFIDQLSISQAKPQRRSDQTPGDGLEPMLDVSLGLFGFLRDRN